MTLPPTALHAGVPWLTAQPSSRLHRQRELSSGKARAKRTRLQFLLPFIPFLSFRGRLPSATNSLPTGRWPVQLTKIATGCFLPCPATGTAQHRPEGRWERAEPNPETKNLSSSHHFLLSHNFPLRSLPATERSFSCPHSADGPAMSPWPNGYHLWADQPTCRPPPSSLGSAIPFNHPSRHCCPFRHLHNAILGVFPGTQISHQICSMNPSGNLCRQTCIQSCLLHPLLLLASSIPIHGHPFVAGAGALTVGVAVIRTTHTTRTNSKHRMAQEGRHAATCQVAETKNGGNLPTPGTTHQ